MRHIFADLDGTLALSGEEVRIPSALTEQVVVVTGGTLEGAIRRLRMAQEVPWWPLKAVLAQSGNHWDSWFGLGRNDYYRRDMTNAELGEALRNAEWMARAYGGGLTEDSIDFRGCQLSLSLVGHNAPIETKRAFDPDGSKRRNMIHGRAIDGLTMMIGGTTCIDFVPFGCEKGPNLRRYMLLHKLDPKDCIYLGDAFDPYQNDASIIGVMPHRRVSGPVECEKILRELLM